MSAPGRQLSSGIAVSCPRTRCGAGGKFQEGQNQDVFLNAVQTWIGKTRTQHSLRLHKASRRRCFRKEARWSNNQDTHYLEKPLLGTVEGQVARALRILFQQGIVPSVHICSCMLKGSLKRMVLAQSDYYLAEHEMGFTSFVGECVVSTLVKCGDLRDAMHVFHTLPHRTVLSWAAVISGHVTAGQGREALRLYDCMQEAGFQPDENTFINALKACGSLSDLEGGRTIHNDVLKFKFKSNLFVGTSLIDMYGRCGSIVDAQNVFDELFERTVVSWNAMLTAYCRQGQPVEALQLYEHMLEEGVSPNDRTLVTSLHACGMAADDIAIAEQPTPMNYVGKGKAIHAYASKNGYLTDIFVGNALISMYCNHEHIVEAWIVFDGLPQRDIVSWNTMLAAYAQQGQAENALRVYEQLREETMRPDVRTFVSAIQACGTLAENECDASNGTEIKFLHKGKAIHAEARKQGCDSNVFLGSSIITMYAKLGSIPDAHTVFEGLPQRNIVSWNAMLAAYVQEGQTDEVFDFYAQMWDQCVSVNERTFVSVLQACGMAAEKEEGVSVNCHLTRAKSLELGKAVHADAWWKGYSTHVFVGNTIVSMYGKCGSLEDACIMFDLVYHKSVVSWNAMLAAYAQQGHEEKTMQLYIQMQEEHSSPDERTFVTALQACGMLAENEAYYVVHGKSTKVQCLKTGKAIHADACMRGYGLDTFVCNTLVSMYGKCGSIEDAKYVFYMLSERSVVAWTALIAAHVDQGQPERALELYEEMNEEGVSPDDRAFVCALQACGLLAEKEHDVLLDGQFTTIGKGKAIHAEAKRKACESDGFVGNALVIMYGKCGSVVDAQNVFDGLLEHDVGAWNGILSAYIAQGQWETVVQMYRQMREDNVSPDEITLVCVLRACSKTGSLDMCRHIHHRHVTTTGIDSNPLLANTLIHTYGSCGSMVDAQSVFDALPKPDVVSWTALIASHARQGNCAASLQCYDKMWLTSGVKPDSVTFLSLLSSCSYAGLVDKGVHYFESMSRDHGLIPEIEHYVSIVDLLGRAGYFSRVHDLISTMPMQPNLVLWLCMLGACRKHGNIVSGKQAFDTAVKLQPKHAATYVLMFNIYSDAGLVGQAQEIMQLRHEAGAWKRPGQSWIEHMHQVHVFVAGDQMHPQHALVYNFLAQLTPSALRGNGV